MTPSTSTKVGRSNTNATGAWLLPYISHVIEALWLFAALLVPLIVLDREYSISEAQIAYIEIPKVALLRALAAFIAVLWAIEWAVSSKVLDQGISSIQLKIFFNRPQPIRSLFDLKNWLKSHPTHWFILAAGMFFGSTFLSTLLSGSFTTSMWGEIPGQDGYSAYSTASWCIIFACIAVRLKKQAQLNRLLGVIVLMGVIVGFYGIMQHNGQDFFGTSESNRVTVFMGNSIFAGAVLAMTTPMTLVAASMALHVKAWDNRWPFSRLTDLSRETFVISLSAILIAIQFLGLMFTFSRGPWSGTTLAIVAFLVLVLISFGWQTLIRSGLILGLASVFSIAFLHWQGSVSIINIGPWLGIIVALLGLASTAATLLIISRFGRAVVFIAIIGIVAATIGAAVMAPSTLFDHRNVDSLEASTSTNETKEQITGRIKSIKTDVLSGFLGGRGTHWKVSWELIKDRPWFAFDSLNFSWARPFVGYGPDLFRYTYLLRSPPEGFDLLPLEPDQAHNYFIHQTVEQGIFGGLTSLAIFVTAFGVVGHQLIRRRSQVNPVYLFILIGMMSIILGRFLEMMVGVARVSDLTILWIIFGLFAASLHFDQNISIEAKPEQPSVRKTTGPQNRNRKINKSNLRFNGSGLIFRLTIVALLTIGISVVSWQKNINYVRASIVEGQALKHFKEGDLESAITNLDKAINLGPGVPTYYQNLAQVFLAYQMRPDIYTHPGCDQQNSVPYQICLGTRGLESNLKGARHQPFNYRANLSAGYSAFHLQLKEIEIDAYARAAHMVPNSFLIRNQYAESLIDSGLYDKAIDELDKSLSVTTESSASSQALFLKGRALKRLKRFDQATEAFVNGILLSPDSNTVSNSIKMLSEINTETAVDLNPAFFGPAIKKNPQDAVSLYFRGLAYLATGNANQALIDLKKSRDLGLITAEVIANIGYARLHAGDDPFEIGELQEAASLSPQVGLYQAFLGESELLQGNYAKALSHLDISKDLNPDLGLAHLTRARLYMSTGFIEHALHSINSFKSPDLPYAHNYVSRGEVWAALAEGDFALADFDKAIRLNPNIGSFYNARAMAYASLGDFENALTDLDYAILLDPSDPRYFINRSVTYEITGKPKKALTDIKTAVALGGAAVPPPEERNKSSFLAYKSIPPSEIDPLLFIKLQTEANALTKIALNSMINIDDPRFAYVLNILGETYMSLGTWQNAIEIWSKFIKVFPDAVDGYMNRGDSYLAIGRYSDAMEDYGRANSLHPNDAKIITAEGRGFAELQEFEKAFAAYNKAIEAEPDTAYGYKYRGYLSIQTNDYLSALADLNRAIKIAPLDSESYSYRSRAHLGLNETLLALNDLDMAINISPLNPNYPYEHALISLDEGDYESANRYLDKAIALQSSISLRNPEPFISRARLNLKLGKPHQAMADSYSAGSILQGYRFDIWNFKRPEIDRQNEDARQLLRESRKKAGAW